MRCLGKICDRTYPFVENFDVSTDLLSTKMSM